MDGDRASQVLERLHTNLNAVPGSGAIDIVKEQQPEPEKENIEISELVSFFEDQYEETKALFESFDIELVGIEVLESGVTLLRSRDQIPGDLIQVLNDNYPSQIVFVPKGTSVMARIES
jgi:hypothetical protein